MGCIKQVVFHSAFLPSLTSDYRNGAKTVCVRFRNGAKIVAKRHESFLHKVKIVLETLKVYKMKNSQIFRIFLCSAFSWGTVEMPLVTCIFFVYTLA